MTFRSKLCPFLFIASFAAFEILANRHVFAQANVQSPAAPAADPALEVSKRAFEALSDAERIAIQDGLIWTGDYKGTADGKFGKGTHDAIIAYAARNKFPADGTLDAKARAALESTAKQAKDNVRFLIQMDAKTGIRIGLPMQLLTKTKPSGTGTRYSSADESFWVETSTQPASATALQELYASTIADQPGRKVTYKVLRPEFFVVTGQTATNTFYTRVVSGMHGANNVLNGITITYPVAAKARFDAITIAVANSFIAFPESVIAPVLPNTVQPTPMSQVVPSVKVTTIPFDGSGKRTDTPAAPGPAPAVQSALGSATNAAAASPSSISASGIIVAPGMILTALPKTCTDPSIRTKKAKIIKQADADGLTLLSLSDAPGVALAMRTSDPKNATDVVVLSFAPQAGNGAGDELIGASGNLHELEPAGRWRLQAAVQSPAAGAAVLDRSGALTGLVPADGAPAKTIAGVSPEMNRTVIPASKLAAFLADTKPKAADRADLRTTGEIVAHGRSSMVSISCPH